MTASSPHLAPDDPRFRLIRRCVDCGLSSLEPLDGAWSCAECGRVYRFNEHGVLLALPEGATRRLPAFYRSAFYRRWMEAWNDMIKDWKIYSRGIYRFFSMSGHRRIARFVREFAPPEGIVVDMGCGAGHLFEHLDTQCPVGLDTNLVFLNAMKRRHPRVLAIQADINNTPFADSSLPCVVSLHTLEHLYFLAESLEEVVRALAENGRFMFTIPTEGGWGWKLGRKLVTGPHLRRKYDLDVERVMAIEHLNDARRVLSFLRFYFRLRRVVFSPFSFLPVLSINSAISGIATPLGDESESKPEI